LAGIVNLICQLSSPPLWENGIGLFQVHRPVEEIFFLFFFSDLFPDNAILLAANPLYYYDFMGSSFQRSRVHTTA
jgi:hypothetical protein